MVSFLIEDKITIHTTFFDLDWNNRSSVKSRPVYFNTFYGCCVHSQENVQTAFHDICGDGREVKKIDIWGEGNL